MIAKQSPELLLLAEFKQLIDVILYVSISTYLSIHPSTHPSIQLDMYGIMRK